jgi:hypothetical protein
MALDIPVNLWAFSLVIQDTPFSLAHCYLVRYVTKTESSFGVGSTIFPALDAGNVCHGDSKPHFLLTPQINTKMFHTLRHNFLENANDSLLVWRDFR